MSRLSKKPIDITGFKVTKKLNQDFTYITLENKNVSHTLVLSNVIDIDEKDSNLSVVLKDGCDLKYGNVQLGTAASLIRGTVEDLNNPYTTVLKLEGVGFRCFVDKDVIAVFAGFSHFSAIAIPTTIKVVASGNTVKISGHRKDVSFFADIFKRIRSWDRCARRGIVVQGEKLYKKKSKKN